MSKILILLKILFSPWTYFTQNKILTQKELENVYNKVVLHNFIIKDAEQNQYVSYNNIANIFDILKKRKEKEIQYILIVPIITFIIGTIAFLYFSWEKGIDGLLETIMTLLFAPICGLLLCLPFLLPKFIKIFLSNQKCKIMETLMYNQPKISDLFITLVSPILEPMLGLLRIHNNISDRKNILTEAFTTDYSLYENLYNMLTYIIQHPIGKQSSINAEDTHLISDIWAFNNEENEYFLTGNLEKLFTEKDNANKSHPEYYEALNTLHLLPKLTQITHNTVTPIIMLLRYLSYTTKEENLKEHMLQD